MACVLFATITNTRRNSEMRKWR